MPSDESNGSSREARTKTDESLALERLRTDDSLKELHAYERRRTSEALSASRQKADKRREEERKAFDRALIDSDIPSSSQSSDTHDALQRERTRANETMRSERYRADRIMETERGARERSERKLLHDERRITDTSLEAERTHTDVHMASADESLSQEKLAHEKARDAVTTRDELLAIVSHDLRNPIGAISSCASMLLEGLGGAELPPTIAHWISLIKNNADTALHLTNDLLDLERIARGRFELFVSECDLYVLMKEAVETFVSAAAAKSILLRVLPPDRFLKAECDHERIKRVLLNLISNSIKFTPHHGHVTLSAEQLADSRICISVADTGPGIPDEQKNVIFERFSQLKNKDRHGLGLGLYISRNIVESHGGKLWVESILGEGSVFKFILPQTVGQTNRSTSAANLKG